MKYNDLLNKHINLAAQKTVDNRSSAIKSEITRKKNDIIDQAINQTAGVMFYPATEKQTIDQSNTFDLNDRVIEHPKKG